MVRTRHAADADDEEPDSFLSLNSRKGRFNKRSLLNDEDSDDSGVVQFNSENGPVGPVRRSTHRTKRVNYVEDDYIDDFDQPVRQTRRSRGSPNSKAYGEGYDSKAQLDVSGEEENVTPTLRQTRKKVRVKKPAIEDDHDEEEAYSSTRKVRVKKPVIEDDHDEEEAYSSTRKTRRSSESQPSPNQSKQVKMEQLLEIEDSGIRRSSRTKKFVYNSFHIGDMMNKEYESGEEPQAKRRRPNPERTVNEDADAEEDNEGTYTDMYSRVKRKRACVKRNMDGHTEEEDEQSDNEEEEEGEEDEEEDEGEDNEEEDKDKPIQSRRSYYLRENKPRTNFYNVIPETRRRRNRFFNEDDVAVPPRTHRRAPIYMSPARKHNIRGTRRRTAFHGGSSSTSSSSSDSSSDEERFQKRKAKSMKKARQRCLPMNFDPDDLNGSSVLRDRQKIGSSLADVDPMNIDRSITFQSVGGLGKHVRALKEMVVFPLLYPEIFERFKISPPRGVLFYGPPGTGKTLVARALANECSKDDRRVAFYMRKGADCLSKWVGESERQLRLLFDQAYQTRPSIIFFDEIDGLAPVRSSRQDQIHSSIVSTLLALMDGLDSRGEIVVIGATNRIDSIDPALRRPGRFDREFLFPLPSLQARSQILKIHTKEWNPALCDKFVTEVAEKCVGYCGADMKALCTEAALLALRRRYPQIYTSKEKLQIDVSSIHIGGKDFYHGMQNIVPTSQRSTSSPARALSTQIQSLLQAQLQSVLTALNGIFPSVLSQLANLDDTDSKKKDDDSEEVYSDDDGNDMSIYEQKNKGRRKNSNIPQTQGKFFDFINYATKQPSTNRPRLMLSGTGDQGQSSHLAPAIIHHLEQLPVHVLDLPSLFAVSARTPEESCAQIFREARRTSPCIVYLPHINQWWNVVGETLKTTLLTLIQDLDPSSPLLLLATSELEYSEVDYNIQDLFDEFSGEVFTMRNPNEEERQAFFSDLILHQTTIPPPALKSKDTQQLEELPKAAPPEPRKLTEPELKKLHEHEEATLTELRIFLRDVLNKLGRDRKFWIFAKPVDIEDVPDYYDIISNPMDLSTMMSKIDLHHYQTVKEFMVDINLVCSNALEYNPDKDSQSRVIRHRACALRDTTNAIIKVELDEEFEKMCQGIAESRSKRGVESTTTAPSYYHTKPLNQGPMHPLAITRKPTPTSQQKQQEIDRNVRLSRRMRGVITDEGPSLEEVEKRARALRSLLRNSPKKENENTPQDQLKVNRSLNTGSSNAAQPQETKATDSQGKGLKAKSGSSTKKSVKKSIWGRSGYKKRRRGSRRRKSEGDMGEGEMEELDNLEDNTEEGDEDVDVDEEEDSEDEMEVEDTVKESVRSPNRLPGRQENLEVLSPSQEISDKSPRTDSDINLCLNIDVDIKSPKDVQKSPSQRSPRSPRLAERQSHTSEQNNQLPSTSSSLNIQSSHLESSSQRSPRLRQTSGSRSPRSHDNIGSHSELSVSGHKSLRRKSLECDKFTVPKVPCVDGGLVDNTNTVNVTGAPSGGDGVHVIVNGFDSGIGSSDSSGDSNDSAGKLISAAVTTMQEENNDKSEQEQKCPESTAVEPEAEPVKEIEEEKSSPKLRVTRSMLHPKQPVDINVEPQPTVVIDKEKLDSLLKTTLSLTSNYTVSRLEKLYSILAQCIYQHRMDLDKSQLLLVMERRLRQYTASVTQRMQAGNHRPVV